MSKNKRNIENALIPNPADLALADIKKQQGMALKSAGQHHEAVKLLQEALSLNSALADVHFTLAVMARTLPDMKIHMEQVNKKVKDKKALLRSYKDIMTVLKGRKQYKESILCHEEICRLFPNDPDEKANLAMMLNIDGQREKALRMLAELIVAYPDNHIYKSIFCPACGETQFKDSEPIIKKALQLFFDNIYTANLSQAEPVWLNVLVNDPVCSELARVALKTDDNTFDDWINNAPLESLKFFQDRFFLDGIRLLLIPRPSLERFFARMRRYLTLNAERLATEKKLDFFNAFLFALAEHYFFNEYISSAQPEETDTVESYIKSLQSPSSDSPLSPEQLYALVGCYRILYKALPSHGEKLAELAKKNPSFASLAKAQFFDQQAEEKIIPQLAAFGHLENSVSKDVQSQYEENPYPRWISVTTRPGFSSDVPMPPSQQYNPWKVLIAGCGTGRQAIAEAGILPNAHITAIDLSRTSLAYGQRKAREAGLADRITFIHADILSMKDWPEQFDIIASSGVLHHMEDPFKGWQTLVDRLKVGGWFKVGLYSETARQQIVHAREFVKEKGYSSSVDDIRACREDILNLPKNDHMRQTLTVSNDFYSISPTRDLIFHVQEHRMTLPQIQDMMNRLHLIPTQFCIDSVSTMQNYDKMFPQDTERKSLENWHKLEQKYPHTFGRMYQFWSQKIS